MMGRHGKYFLMKLQSHLQFHQWGFFPGNNNQIKYVLDESFMILNE